ncbi:hypothetical protein Lser_V15G29053 [Lactuca serriola]
MEGVSVSMKEACDRHIFQGISLPHGGPILSHLMYVGEWSGINFLNLNRILRCFFLASGLKVNLCKSKVFGIGVDDIDIAMLASILHCESASFPFSYLGLPIGDNMKLTRNWNPIVKKFNAKLSLWKARSLSFGGRLTIVKSNLSSLPLYYFSNFKAPKKIIELLEELFTTSIVLMENLWLNVEIRGWNRTHFWKEKWCGDITLKDTFPKLYKIESNKNCKVSDRLEGRDESKGSYSWLFSVSYLRGLMALNLGANGNMADFQWHDPVCL